MIEFYLLNEWNLWSFFVEIFLLRFVELLDVLGLWLVL